MVDTVAVPSAPAAQTTWQARPTVYRGIRMRSRLEARWAAYWDLEDEAVQEALGQRCLWRYEPICFAGRGGQYLPDFELQYFDLLGNPKSTRQYQEVKPVLKDPLPVMQQMEVIWESEPRADLDIVVGDPTDAFYYYCRRFHPFAWFEWQDQEGETVREVPEPPWFCRVRDNPLARQLYDERDWATLDRLEFEAWDDAR